MSEAEKNSEGIEEAELLLPWYVAGTLSETDRLKVDLWLAQNPEAEAHLDRADEEREVVFAAGEKLGYPRPGAVNNLMRAIGAKAPATTAAPGIVERIWEMLSPRYAMAGAAALALLVVAQGTYIGLNASRPTTSFETAIGGGEIIDETTALVSFAPDIPAAEISETLTRLGLRVIDGPKPGGIYRIAAPKTEAGRAALTELGNDSRLVRFFAPAEGE